MKLMETLSLNNQQLKAIDHNRNIVLNAGAGTGKTHVLVARIVHLIEQIESLELKHIVAITFTIKAASELQDRLKNAFIKKISNSDSLQIQHKFKIALEQLSTSNISTIHGFLNRCLRHYSLEADLDSQYRIVSDYERIEIKESAIIDLLRDQLLENDKITNLYNIYGRFDFFRHLNEILENPQLVETIQFTNSQGLKEHWHKQQENYKKDLLDKIQSDKKFKYILESVSKLHISGNPNKEIIDFKHALQQVYLDLTDLNALQNLKLTFLNKDSSIKKTLLKRFDINHQYSLEQLAKFITTYTDQILPHFNQHDQDYFEHYPTLVSFVKEIIRRQLIIKKESNLLDFNDLEIQAKRLFERSHFAKSELRKKYRFFLIDEFQDTNSFQWEIIEQLLLNERNQMHSQKTFIVGDPKQSIYGFRDADVRVFKKVIGDLTETNRKNNSLTKAFAHSKDMNSTMSEKEGLIVLNENYRSESNIVKNVNELFERIFNSNNEYDVESQSLIKAKKSLDKTFENEILLAISKDSQLEYELICQQIISACKAGFNFKDICILVRSRTNASQLEATLRKHHINYQSFLNQNFFNRQEIYDAYSLIRFAAYPEDDIALSSLLKSPFFKINDSEIFKIKTEDYKTSLFSKLQKINHSSLNLLIKILTLAGRMPVYDWLNYCFYRFNYFDSNPIFRNQLESNINKLIELIETKISRNSQDIYAIESFIKKQIDLSFEESEAEIIINENDDKVRLMTIHNSKGLEFPFVIIPDINKNSSRSSESLYINFDYGFYLNSSSNNDEKVEKGFCESFFKIKKSQREQAEEKRILYVAMTRAEKKIILTGSLIEKSTEKIRSNSFLDLIKQSTKQDFIKQCELKLVESKIKVTSYESIEELKTNQKLEIQIDKKKTVFSTENSHIASGNYFSVTKLETFKNPEDYKQKYLIGWFEEDQLFQFAEKNNFKTKDPASGSIYGTMLHDLFETSMYQEINIQSCQQIFKKYSLAEAETDIILNQLLSDYSNFKTSEKTKFIRTAQTLLREQRLTIKIDDDYFEGILDLLIYDGINWTIVDYKSNRLDKSELIEKSSQYQFQMKSYAFLLSKLYPKQRVYAVHLYYPRIDELFLIEYKFEELKLFEEEVKKRINEIKTFESGLLFE